MSQASPQEVLCISHIARRKNLSENGWHFNFIRREDEPEDEDEKVIKVKRTTGKYREKGLPGTSSNKLRNHKINDSQAK